MFGRNKKKEQKVVESLKNQAIGGQSVIYRLFASSLEIPPNHIRRIELTYFSLAVLSYAFMAFGTHKSKAHIMDQAVLQVFEESLPSCGESLRDEVVIREYQRRYQEYSALLQPVFSDKQPDPVLTLFVHVVECVTQNRAQPASASIMTEYRAILEFILNNIDFVRKEI